MNQLNLGLTEYNSRQKRRKKTRETNCTVKKKEINENDLDIIRRNSAKSNGTQIVLPFDINVLIYSYESKKNIISYCVNELRGIIFRISEKK